MQLTTTCIWPFVKMWSSLYKLMQFKNTLIESASAVSLSYTESSRSTYTANSLIGFHTTYDTLSKTTTTWCVWTFHLTRVCVKTNLPKEYLKKKKLNSNDLEGKPRWLNLCIASGMSSWPGSVYEIMIISIYSLCVSVDVCTYEW